MITITIQVNKKARMEEERGEELGKSISVDCKVIVVFVETNSSFSLSIPLDIIVRGIELKPSY